MDEKDFNIPPAVLSDLCSRFIINVPEEERTDLIRIFFQIEIAHWFYLDFYCDSSFSTISASSCNQLTRSPNFSMMTTTSISPYNDANGSSSSNDESNDTHVIRQQQQLMKPCSIRTFAENIFRHCPFLMQHTNQVDDILSKWKVFKHAVPTNGAIILDESMRNVLLVQGFWAKTSWGFPKGKVVEDESEAHCAQREVLEETGYDITDKLKDDQYLEIQINDQTIRLYIIPGVSMAEKFEPRTRREIKDVRWFAIDELPVHRKDVRTKQTLGYSPNSFFMVIPFLKALKHWIFANNRDVNYGQSGYNNSSGKLYSRPHSTINQPRHSNNTSHHHHHHHHHGHHHHHHHNNSQRTNNSNISQSVVKKSKSNENLSTLNVSGSKSNKANVNNNNNMSQKVERVQSVKHNYQKLQQNEIAEFLNCKEKNKQNSNGQQQQPKTPKDNNNNSVSNMNQNQTSTGKFNHSQLGSNSKFRPINAENNINNKLNKFKMNNGQQLISSNITILPIAKKQFQSGTNQQQFINNSRHQVLSHNLNDHIQSMNCAKKHLEFNGPECWINFKFDLNSIVQDLPQL